MYLHKPLSIFVKRILIGFQRKQML